jgi:hypothetical protein
MLAMAGHTVGTGIAGMILSFCQRLKPVTTLALLSLPKWRYSYLELGLDLKHVSRFSFEPG